LIKRKLDILTGTNYPSEYIEALTLLDDAAKSHKIASTSKKIVGKFSGYWLYLCDLKLDIPHFEIVNDRVSYNRQKFAAESIGHFISNNCNGDISEAILQIDKFTDSINFWVEKNDDWELLKRLQQTGSFLRDVRTISSRSKIRPNRDRIDEYQSIEDLMSKGFCLLCSQPTSLSNKYRCDLHIKSKATEAQIKKIQRMINNAYINLSFIDRKDKKSKDESFRGRCYVLEGWAKHQVIQKSFVYKIEKIEHILLTKIDNKLLATENLQDCFNKIVNLCREFEHTRTIFDNSEDSSFHFDISECGISNAELIINDNKKVTANISKEYLSKVITVIIREAQFCLIRTASKSNKISIIDKWELNWSSKNLSD
jgi:hypothetical protein